MPNEIQKGLEKNLHTIEHLVEATIIGLQKMNTMESNCFESVLAQTRPIFTKVYDYINKDEGEKK